LAADGSRWTVDAKQLFHNQEATPALTNKAWQWRIIINQPGSRNLAGAMAPTQLIMPNFHYPANRKPCDYQFQSRALGWYWQDFAAQGRGCLFMEQQSFGQNEPIMMPGPKFGENQSWWSNNRSNIILAIIGVLIIVGGIYLYANYQKPNPSAELKQENQINEQNIEGVVKPEQINLDGQTVLGQNTETTKEKVEIVKIENSKYTLKANAGAGITHLARKAAKEYLERNTELKNKITAEHKIYIEDYIKDKTGSYGLKIGQELTFDDGLIKEAIDQSLKLNENQLQNLHKYALLVPSLS